MQNEIQTLIQKCKADYTKFVTASGRGTPEPDSYFGKTLANFENSFTIKEGKKYIKIIRDNGVWGFIVKEDGPKFKKGDILKLQAGMHQQQMPLVVTFLETLVLLGLVHIT